MNQRLVAVLILSAEVLVAGYLALIAGLLSAWMMDDDQAFRMTGADWLLEGGRRFAVALLVAVVFAVVAGLAHRRWVMTAMSPAWMRWIPASLGGCVALASAAGASWFVVSRPFV